MLPFNIVTAWPIDVSHTITDLSMSDADTANFPSFVKSHPVTIPLWEADHWKWEHFITIILIQVGSHVYFIENACTYHVGLLISTENYYLMHDKLYMYINEF